jgi:hypothetical protein
MFPISKVSNIADCIWTDDDDTVDVNKLRISMFEVLDVEEITSEEYLILKMSGVYDAKRKT